MSSPDLECHDDHLSKIELKSGPQRETRACSLAGATLCSGHKICQRFRSKVEEAMTLQPEEDTLSGGPISSIKNSESKMFGALYDEFRNQNESSTYFDLDSQHMTVELVLTLFKTLLETEPRKRSKVKANISVRFLEFLGHQGLTSLQICPKELLKSMRAFVGATRRGLRGSDSPSKMSALKFLELTTKNRILLYWVNFLASDNF